MAGQKYDNKIVRLMEQLDPKAKSLFYLYWLIGYFIYFLIIFLPIFIVLSVSLAIASQPPLSVQVELLLFLVLVFISLILFSVGLAIFAIIYPPLFYESYKYGLQDEALVIEKGVWWKKHIYIPYGRIQNIDIVQGPLSRKFGLSGLHIQTAGISGSGLIEGQIPGILPDKAQKIKDAILLKTTKLKNQGL